MDMTVLVMRDSPFFPGVVQDINVGNLLAAAGQENNKITVNSLITEVSIVGKPDAPFQLNLFMKPIAAIVSDISPIRAIAY